VPNESGGGPRLAIDVEAMSATLEPVRHDGSLSLMLLEPTVNGPPKSLARWDYNAVDAAALQDQTPDHPMMRFHLELPPDTPTDQNTELWVRLMPERGGKVLQHVDVDLRGPGRFESMLTGVDGQERWADKQQGGSLPVIADSNNAIEAPTSNEVAPHSKTPIKTIPIKTTPIHRRDDEGWTIARPDRPGSTGGNRSDGTWRAASGPLPEIAESVAAPSRKFIPQPAVQQAAFLETAKTLQPPVSTSLRSQTARAATAWTPERGGKSANSARTQSEVPQTAARPARPVWTPLR
jgi:hypothetical protein